jgi:hypothetical protein
MSAISGLRRLIDRSVRRLHDERSHTVLAINKEVFADEAALTTWQRTVASQAFYLAVACGVFGLNVDEMV